MFRAIANPVISIMKMPEINGVILNSEFANSCGFRASKKLALPSLQGKKQWE